MLLFSPKAPRLIKGDYNITIFSSFIYAHTQTTDRNCTENQIKLTYLGICNSGHRKEISSNYKTLYFSKKSTVDIVIHGLNTKNAKLKVFFLVRHKRYQIYTCLQLSSSTASFVWKLSHFEFRSYGSASRNAKIAFVEKYTLIS